MTRPGITNLPVLVISLVQISAMLHMILATTVYFISSSFAIALAMALFVMALMGPFIPFMGALVGSWWRWSYRLRESA